jgi:sugar fermentation stimulation protein A
MKGQIPAMSRCLHAYPSPLLPGHLIQRYKRFLADIRLEDGRQVTAHCANPGSMIGLKEPETPVYLADVSGAGRKLDYSWELALIGETFVGINTGRPNALVAKALDSGLIPELAGYGRRRREVPYGESSRIDLLLESDDLPPCYLEIKNVNLKRGNSSAEFPDAVTKRGAKHLRELTNKAQSGARAVMFYLVQRDDCSDFAIARDIDPDYDAELRQSLKAGVEVLCYDCHLGLESIDLGRRLPFPGAPA